MKVMIMKCINNEFWYANKIGKTYKVQELSWPNKDCITEAGIIRKKDAIKIEK